MTAEYRPRILDAREAEMLKNAPTTTYVDAFSRQLKELYLIDEPSARRVPKDEALASARCATFCEQRNGTEVYVFYPWNNTLVRTVGAGEYVRLLTNRNQDLITAEEQVALYNTRVAVCGLSVGSNVAYALAQAGISRRMVLADFDELDTTNLNRIIAGLHHVGLNKTYISARAIYEHNPFADVRVFDTGIDARGLEQLLAQNEIDIVVDEVDDMRFKIDARRLAMQYKKPVVMATDNGDGIVLHVERYDLGHDRIFGKPLEFFDSLPAEMSREDAGRMIMETIVGGAHRVDPRMLSSVKRVLARELVSWSQLGTAALLAGVAVTYMIKQIVLQRDSRKDIRAYIAPHSGEWSSHG